MKLNLFQHAKDCNVIDTITIEDYITYIKDGYDVDQILKARTYGKGTIPYKKIKEQRNAVCFNYLFNGYKTNDNIIESTGMLFFDIDDTTFSLNDIDMSKIFIAHSSFGGNGYSIIVKVDGITKDNFKEAYINIAHQLGITGKYDIGARKRTQFTLMSFDPNIIVNNDCNILIHNIQKSITTPIVKLNIKSITTPIVKGYINILKKRVSKDRISGSDTFLKLIFQSQLDEYTEDCVFIKEGHPFYKCFLPFKADGSYKQLADGEKHQVLTQYLNNLLCLNPNITHKQASVTLRSVIKTSCNQRVSEVNIENMIQYTFGKLREGTIQPTGVKLKYYWVSPSVANKFEAYKDKRSAPTKEALEFFVGCELLNLEIKCTNKVIAQMMGISEITVKRRLTDEQKAAIKTFNAELKLKRITNNKIEVDPEDDGGFISQQEARFKSKEVMVIAELKIKKTKMSDLIEYLDTEYQGSNVKKVMIRMDIESKKITTIDQIEAY